MSQSTTHPITTLSEWDEFLLSRRPETGFKQSTWWTDFLRIRDWSAFTVAARESGEIIGGANILRKSFASEKCFYYLPHGPVLPTGERDARDVFEALLAHIDDERRDDTDVVSHLRIETLWTEKPEFLTQYPEVKSWMDARRTLVVDLTQSAEQILAQMKPKGRYNVRLAERKGVTIIEDTSEQGIEDFQSIYRDTFDRHELRGHTRKYLRELSRRLVDSDRGTILFAEFESRRIATMMLICFGDTATYKYGGSLTTDRHVMAPYLMHYEAMLRVKARGHRWYDFYGVGPANEPDDDWANFSAFKRKFGGSERVYVPGVDVVFDKEAYEAYRNG